MLDNDAMQAVLAQASINEQVQFWRPLHSDTTNLLYKICTSQRQLILKQFAHNKVLPVDRVKQFNLQRLAHNHGLAPMPIWLSEDESYQIENWINGELIKERDLHALNQTLCAMHQISAVGYEMDIMSLWGHYAVYLPQKHALGEQLSVYTEQWQKFIRSHDFEFTLCHNDMQFSHLSNQPPLCFDWEYAGQHCRFFDLASSIKINQLDEGEESQLLALYAATNDLNLADVNNLVLQAKPFVDYTFLLWSAVTEQ